jgi:hypothetical protein
MNCENDEGNWTHPFAARTGLLLSALCVALSLAACGGDGSGTSAGSQGPVDTTTTLTWDSVNEAWVPTARSAAALEGAPSRSEIEVDLPANEAVKLISAREVQIVDPSDQALLEIAGRDDSLTGSSGKIVICKLFVKKVDIEELIVENVKASRVTVVDFAAEDGLGVEVVPVNVIRCGRGGVGVVGLGAESLENEDLIGAVPDAVDEFIRPASDFVFTTNGKEGARLNEVRILGPEGKDAFVETIFLNRSSVFGRVKLKNLEIKELIIETVTVDDREDSIPTP